MPAAWLRTFGLCRSPCGPGGRAAPGVRVHLLRKAIRRTRRTRHGALRLRQWSQAHAGRAGNAAAQHPGAPGAFRGAGSRGTGPAARLAAEAAERERAQLQQAKPVVAPSARSDQPAHAAWVYRGPPGMLPSRSSPWPWQKVRTSIAVFTAPDGRYWVRVQHQDESQKLVPWPRFPGWESALPPGIGVVDQALGVIAVNDIVEAIRILQRSGYQGPRVGAWQEVLPRLGSLAG